MKFFRPADSPAATSIEPSWVLLLTGAITPGRPLGRTSDLGGPARAASAGRADPGTVLVSLSGSRRAPGSPAACSRPAPTSCSTRWPLSRARRGRPLGPAAALAIGCAVDRSTRRAAPAARRRPDAGLRSRPGRVTRARRPSRALRQHGRRSSYRGAGRHLPTPSHRQTGRLACGRHARSCPAVLDRRPSRASPSPSPGPSRRLRGARPPRPSCSTWPVPSAIRSIWFAFRPRRGPVAHRRAGHDRVGLRAAGTLAVACGRSPVARFGALRDAVGQLLTLD